MEGNGVLITRRHMLGLMGMAATTVAVGACGSSVDDASDSRSGSGPGGTLRVGLLVPQAGVYAPLGTDMTNGWNLWLDQHDNTIGGFEVDTATADEGEGPETGVPALQQLLRDSDVMVGVVNSAVALGSVDAVTEARKLLVVSNAGAGDLTGSGASPYIWRTSFTNAQVAAAMGQHLAGEQVGSVYVIAPDYAAGAEAIGGFRQAFEADGGEVAGEATPPFGTTQDYQPFLAQIEGSGADACFCFFAGAEAVAFVRQYREFGLADAIPLYGSGFLTEGGVLEAQGRSAVGVRTSLHYSTELTNEANTAFVDAYQQAFDAPPTVYAMQTYDAAAVLDRALSASEDPSGDALSEVLGDLGEIDSPRGPWTFDGQSPRQAFYLREVQAEGDRFVNAVVGELGTLAQP
jgi:branched-chain amino acid transport system substrate-binding protein